MMSEYQSTVPFLIACHECGRFHRIGMMPAGGTALCSRCGAVLHRNKKNSVARSFAFMAAGIILFVIANVYPFLGFRIGGQIRQSTLITGVMELFHQDLWILSALVLLTTILVPAFQLAGMLYVLLPFYFRLKLPKRMEIFRMVRHFQPWGMTEVFLLGILVALIKLSKMATILPGTALYAFTALMVVLAAMLASLDPHIVWIQGGGESMRFKPDAGKPPGHISCRSCHLVCRRPSAETGEKIYCPRCGAALHHRRPGSIHRTWALVIAAYIFYIPANVFPITHVVSFGKAQSDTILSGVVYFATTGMWPIALVIFTASVLVPLFKLVILTGLLISVHQGTTWRPRLRAQLYRITEAVGRWSMLDIFVVTILVALVRLGNIASVEAGSAAVFFAAVVVLTMLAATSFDPRLIWDSMEMPYDGK